MITRNSEYDDLDWDELREDLLEIYGSGVSFHPNLPVQIIDIDHASEDELIAIAKQSGLDPNSYMP